jgi:hypothetical protein
VPLEVLLVHLDLQLHRAIDIAAVAGGDEVQQQTAGDGNSQVCLSPRSGRRHALPALYLGNSCEPGVKRGVEQGLSVRATL